MVKGLRRVGVIMLGALAAGVFADSAHAQPPISHCSTTGQNLFVHDVLAGRYLWYQFLPRVDPVSFSSPDEYLDAVRYPLDRGFSYITSRAANDAFFDDSQFIGFGFSFRADATELRLREVFAGSPAAEAGLARGSRIVEINGRSIASLRATNALDAALGPDTIGLSADLTIDTGNGGRRRVQLVKRLVTIPTASDTRLTIGGMRVGYLNFRNFVQPSNAALDAAFARFRQFGVDELVIDLRYNGGGLVDVAVKLGSLVGGAATDGQVFAELRHNARNSALNQTFRFRSEASALGLRRVFVIATRASASASELVINALRPFMPVIVVGETTYGKPVGQNPVPFCDQVLAPVTFATVNANGQGDYFDGIPADCPAADDLDHQFGDPDEASLAAALTFIRTGACRASAASASTQSSAGAPGGAPLSARVIGWRALVNAY